MKSRLDHISDPLSYRRWGWRGWLPEREGDGLIGDLIRLGGVGRQGRCLFERGRDERGGRALQVPRAESGGAEERRQMPEDSLRHVSVTCSLWREPHPA